MEVVDLEIDMAILKQKISKRDNIDGYLLNIKKIMKDDLFIFEFHFYCSFSFDFKHTQTAASIDHPAFVFV